MEANAARRLWQAAECLHAVTYFHPAALAALADAGAKGFWMGYFAARMAPLGPVGPSTATAVCCNFSPARAARALPDAWTFVSPTDALAARATGAAAALRGCGISDGAAATAVDVLGPVVSGFDPSGRPLGGANLDVALPSDPVGRLWQLCTTLREHRGDGHVALIVGSGLDGCEVDVLATAVAGIDPAVLRDSRAWTGQEWDAAIRRLAIQGLVDVGGGRTDLGVALYAGLEARTDDLAERSYRGTDIEVLRELLWPLARSVMAAGVLPFPNPIGLPGGPGVGQAGDF